MIRRQIARPTLTLLLEVVVLGHQLPHRIIDEDGRLKIRASDYFLNTSAIAIVAVARAARHGRPIIIVHLMILSVEAERMTTEVPGQVARHVVEDLSLPTIVTIIRRVDGQRGADV